MDRDADEDRSDASCKRENEKVAHFPKVIEFRGFRKNLDSHPDSAMTSSLATQLAQGASLNSSLLVDRSKRRYAESYLFTGKEANHHDLYSVHALALNGFTHLRSVNPALRTFEHALFSDAAKSIDRTLLTKEKAEELSLTIGKFLRLLGPYLLDAPSGKILEWLVRRFR